MVANKTGAILKYVGIRDDQTLDLDQYKTMLNAKTKIVAIAHASNVLGCINPVKEMTEAAHQVGAVVLVDACQSAAHMNIDVSALDCDFLVISAHKVRLNPKRLWMIRMTIEQNVDVWPYRNRCLVRKTPPTCIPASCIWWRRHGRRGEYCILDICHPPKKI